MSNLDSRLRTSRCRRHAARLVFTLIAGGLFPPSSSFAQSQAPLSVQGSVLSTLVTADGTSALGIGGEVQLRLNVLGMSGGTLAYVPGMRGRPSVLSLGGGAQHTSHVFRDGTLSVSGAFVEPRLAWGPREDSVGRDLTNVQVQEVATWFRYAALRVAVLQQSSPAATSSTGYAVGGGGGLVRTIGSRRNLDIGAAVLYQRFGDALTPSGRSFRFRGAVSFALKMGITVGFGGE